MRVEPRQVPENNTKMKKASIYQDIFSYVRQNLLLVIYVGNEALDVL